MTGLPNTSHTPATAPQPDTGIPRRRRSFIAAAEAYGRLERRWLRRQLRESGAVLIIAAGIAGSAGGLVASLMLAAANYFHALLFGLQGQEHLSAAAFLDWRQMLAALLAGGLLLGLSTVWWRQRIGAIADPIEANALHGGRMSTADSIFVAGQCLVSSAAGASLGLEGGFTQLASAIGSKLGRLMRRRRHDVRMLVGAGAAGAIAGAFTAPFAGAAYGFELIIGSYTTRTLAPVAVASVAGTLTAWSLSGHGYHIEVPATVLAGGHHLLLLPAIGIICGLLAVGVMRGVTATEQLARHGGLPRMWRPLAGALALAGLGWLTPHALGSGHGGTEMVLTSSWPLPFLALVLAVKIAASSISIGSGFRGGLFSTSLFLGALTGACAGRLAAGAGIAAEADITLFTLVGMAAFGAAVVGAPMTMALLVIEISGKLDLAGPVLAGVVASMLTVRAVFGYSFATWRFHLRGEAILGGEDVGWMHDTTAAALMRRDMKTVPATACVDEVCARFPLGAVKWVAVVDSGGAFLGLADIAVLHAAAGSGEVAGSYIEQGDASINGDETIASVLSAFETRETEILVVTGSSGKVLGYVTEAFALRRYRQELDRRQHEIFGNGS